MGTYKSIAVTFDTLQEQGTYKALGGTFTTGAPDYEKLHLIKYNNTIYTYDGTEWVDTELQEPVSDDGFHQYGMETEDLEGLPQSALDTLKEWNEFNVLTWFLVGYDNESVDYQSVPQPQVIEANDDINLSDVFNIAEWDLEHTTSGEGTILIATSLDSGTSYNNHEGEEVDITDTDDFKAKGMTPTQFKDYVEGLDVYNDVDTIRNAYLLDMGSVNDEAEMSELNSVMEFVGALVKQMTGDNVEVKLDNDKIKVEYKSGGHYVFNIIH